MYNTICKGRDALILYRSVWALCDGMLRTLSGGEPSSNKWIILCAADKSGGEPSSNKWIILCAADKSVRYDMK